MLHKDTTDCWFRGSLLRVQEPKPIDGFFKHYHDLGVDFIRMDFLSWYKDGFDRNMGRELAVDMVVIPISWRCNISVKQPVNTVFSRRW